MKALQNLLQIPSYFLLETIHNVFFIHWSSLSLQPGCCHFYHVGAAFCMIKQAHVFLCDTFGCVTEKGQYRIHCRWDGQWEFCISEVEPSECLTTTHLGGLPQFYCPCNPTDLIQREVNNSSFFSGLLAILNLYSPHFTFCLLNFFLLHPYFGGLTFLLSFCSFYYLSFSLQFDFFLGLL